MIKVNLESALAQIEIVKHQEKVEAIVKHMEDPQGEDVNVLGWKDLPLKISKEYLQEIQDCADLLIKKGVEVLVVIGIGGSFAGSKAAIQMVQGEYPKSRKMEVIFAGESLSSTNLAQKLEYVSRKKFAINVISKSGRTIEPAIAFRLFKKLLEKQVGVANATELIIATTDETKGALRQMANQKNYKTFVIPSDVGGRFSVLTSVGLLPMACAGLNINHVIDGALEAHQQFSVSNLETNTAYKYAVARHILAKKYPIEIMIQYEPQLEAFSEWWKQLAGESEGKKGAGVFPSSCIFSTDLHSLGQFIQEGSRVLFQTVLTFAKPNLDLEVAKDNLNLDNLNYLSSRTIHEINKIAFESTKKAHFEEGKVPIIHMEIEKMNEKSFGYLVTFFQRAVAMTAYLQGVNPFDQPGVEVYKTNMIQKLKS